MHSLKSLMLRQPNPWANQDHRSNKLQTFPTTAASSSITLQHHVVGAHMQLLFTYSGGPSRTSFLQLGMFPPATKARIRGLEDVDTRSHADDMEPRVSHEKA